MEKFTQIEAKINEISTEFGFREFAFGADKFETAQRALSRFVKAMNNRINRDEIENKENIKLKLDFISNLIKRTLNARFKHESAEKVEFILENDAATMLQYHKNTMVKYYSVKLPKELKFHYTILKNYYAYKTYAESDEGAKASLEILRNANKEVFDAIKKFEGTTEENLEKTSVLRSDLVKNFSMLFNSELIEQAVVLVQLNKEKVDEINKTYLASKPKQFAKKKQDKRSVKKRIDMSKVKSNATKTAYTDKGAENNPFAALLGSVKK